MISTMRAQSTVPMKGVTCWSAFSLLSLSFELCMRDTPFQKVAFTPIPSSPAADQRAYLADAMERCTRVCNMYEAAKKNLGK